MVQFWTITYNNNQKTFLLNEGDEELINPVIMERLQRLVVDLNMIGPPPIMMSLVLSFIILLVTLSSFIFLLLLSYRLWAIIVMIIVIWLYESKISNFFNRKYNNHLTSLIRIAVDDLSGTYHSRIIEPILPCNEFLFTVWFIPNIIVSALGTKKVQTMISIIELSARSIESVEIEFFVNNILVDPNFEAAPTLFPETLMFYNEPCCDLLKEDEAEEKTHCSENVDLIIKDLNYLQQC